jgi:GAF domain-containing protein
MDSSVIIDHSLPKKERYVQLQKALKSLMEVENDFLANQANTAALIFHAFDFHWVGFYWVKGQELVLGAFQGPVACTRIAKGRGVCGTCWEKNEVQLVPNVHEFPGHIACSALSQSELVLPIVHQGQIVGVLDIDSVFLDDFDADDVDGMSALVKILEEKWTA